MAYAQEDRETEPNCAPIQVLEWGGAGESLENTI